MTNDNKEDKLEAKINPAEADTGEKTQNQPMEAKDKMSKKKTSRGKKSAKNKRIPVIIGAVVLVLAVCIIVPVTRSKANPEKLLQKADKYFSAAQYEKAEEEYLRLINWEEALEGEILTDAYIGLGSVYINTEKTDSALNILSDGFEITESGKIKELLDGIMPAETQASEKEAAEKAVPDTPVVFKDSAFEKMIKLALGKPEDSEVLESELAQIRTLKIAGGTHAVVNERLHTLNSVEGYRVEGVLYDKIGDIKSIEDLKYFINLNRLVISYNQIEDISVLAEMKNLDTLGLYFNKIRDISALSELPSLRYLYIYNNNIADISPLSGLKELKELYIQNNQINDINALKSLNNLKVLAANNNQISSISVVADMESLKEVSFIDNPVLDMSPAEEVEIVNQNVNLAMVKENM